MTLLELLIAMALLAVVLALTYGSFFQLSDAAAGLKAELAEQQELRLLLKLIADDLQAAQYLEGYAANGDRRSGIVARTHFVGRGEFTEINFHVAAPARFHRQRPPEADPGLHEAGYAVREDLAANTLTLVRREDYYLDPDLETGGVTVVLTRDVETFSIGFLGPAEASNPTQDRWEREWDSQTRPKDARMPRAVRISLGVMGKDGKPLRATLEVNLQSVLKVGQ
jgi:prepilin-type N-terminal cleavage/methylation domain-containing protein